MFRGTIIVSVICFAVLLSGCSSQNVESPVVPGEGPAVESNILHSNRLILAAGNIRFDPGSLLVEFVASRNALAHWNGTPWLTPPNCDDCIIIEVLEFKPGMNQLKLKISINNPTTITLSDVRGILVRQKAAIYLLNADSYTRLYNAHCFDGLEYLNVNPFKAFATDWPQRKFLPGTGHSRIYEIQYSELADILYSKLVIECSWPGNCKEPYEITDIYVTGKFIDYGSQDIWCQVYSWEDNVESVIIDLSGFGQAYEMQMVYQFDNWWAAKDIFWHCGRFEAGKQRLKIRAFCEDYELELTNYVDVDLVSSSPSYGWAQNWGGPFSDRGRCVVLDNNGNIFVSGAFCSTVDFDPGPDYEKHTTLGGSDIFVSKFNTAADHEWTLTLGGDGSDKGYCMVADDYGNVYVAGCFKDAVDFDPGVGSDEHISAGGEDIFITRIDPQGEVDWTRTWGAEYDDVCYGITVGESGDIYLTGHYRGSVDFDPGPGVESHISGYQSDTFLSKFNTDGKFEWVRTWGSYNYDVGKAVGLDSCGDIYVTGYFGLQVDFDPGPGYDKHNSNGSGDAFLSKFNSDGEFQWVETWGGITHDSGSALEIDDSNNIYITGYFTEDVDFDPGTGTSEFTSEEGSRDVFLSKFSTDGQFQWVRTWGGSKSDTGKDISLSATGDVYVMGRFDGAVDFNPGTEPDIFVSYIYSTFLTIYSESGEYKCTRAIRRSFGYGIASDPQSNVYITGCFCDTVDFDPGMGADKHQSNGESDVFIVKLDPNANW